MTRGLAALLIVAALLFGYGMGWTVHAAHDANYIRQQEVNSFNDGWQSACMAAHPDGRPC